MSSAAPAATEGKCPVDHSSGTTGKCPVDHSSSAGKCPVDHSKMSSTQLKGFTNAMYHERKAAQAAQAESTAMPEKGCSSEAMDAKLNPRNMMVPENQKPSPGQKVPLSTSRVKSTIPKGNVAEEEGNWMYPSPQMFYNAMKRKGYEANEEDMHNIVAIHNAVNERSWMEVMKWEQHHFSTCPNPKLHRFRGRPNDLSLKARWRSLTGSQPPFDRHDWVVDRCGTEVRYIIDYYQGKAPRDSIAPSFFLDVRPALDRPGAFVERGTQWFRDTWKNLKKMWSV